MMWEKLRSRRWGRDRGSDRVSLRISEERYLAAERSSGRDWGAAEKGFRREKK